MLKSSTCKNSCILVGADKGGVGKTTFSRLLLDYAGAVAGGLRVFDTEPAPGVLKRFYPEAALVNLADPTDQARIIDGLASARATIVDVGAGNLSPTLHLLQRIGLKHGEETRIVVFHVLGNNVASLAEIEVTRALLEGGGDHVLVKNRAAAGKFFEWDQAALDRLNVVDAGNVVEIGYLEAVAAERVDQRGQSFSAFADDPSNSRVMRGYVRAWASDGLRALEALGARNLFA